MKYNKGFSDITIILITIGIVAVGYFAYHAGKNNSKIVDNTGNQNSSDCKPGSAPSIRVLSPNGGERYKAGQEITITWTSCNVSADTQLEVSLSKSAASGSSTTILPTVKNTPNDGSEFFTLESALYDYFTGPAGDVFKINISVYGSGASDDSDKPFTILGDSLSPTLPQYVSGQAGWPPAIQTSSAMYSCKTAHSEMSDTVQKVIGSRMYCVTKSVEGAAGHSYAEYTYKTVSGTGTKTTNFTLGLVNCGVYDHQQMSECEQSQKHFLDGLDGFVDSLM